MIKISIMKVRVLIIAFGAGALKGISAQTETVLDLSQLQPRTQDNPKYPSYFHEWLFSSAKKRRLQFSCPAAAVLPGDWSCPAEMCPSGGCRDAVNQGYNPLGGGNASDWLIAHNTYRCMHNLPGLSWNNEDFDAGWAHFQS